MPSRSWAFPIVLVSATALSLFTLEPGVSLFTQTFRTAGLVTSEVASAERATTPTPRAAAVTATPSVTQTPVVTSTAVATATPPATQTPRATASPVATPTFAVPTVLATLPPPATFTPVATGTSTPTQTPTATSTPVACPPRGLSMLLEPDPAANATLKPATGTALVLRNAGNVVLPAGAGLRVTPMLGGERLGRLTLMGEMWTPDAKEASHIWRLQSLPAGASTRLELRFEERAALTVGPVTSAALSNSSAAADMAKPRPWSLKLRLEVLLPCASAEVTVATTDVLWTAPQIAPAPMITPVVIVATPVSTTKVTSVQVTNVLRESALQ